MNTPIYSQINIDNYNYMFKNSVLPYKEDFNGFEYNNDIFIPYKIPEPFQQPIIKEWKIVALVIGCDKENITVSTIDPISKEQIYKLIPKNKIDFTCFEDDYILIDIVQLSDYPEEPQFEYKISQYNIYSNNKTKQQIINKIKQRTKGDSVI